MTRKPSQGYKVIPVALEGIATWRSRTTRDDGGIVKGVPAKVICYRESVPPADILPDWDDFYSACAAGDTTNQPG